MSDFGILPNDASEEAQPGFDLVAKLGSEAELLRIVVEAVSPLVDACYAEMHGTVCDDEPDDEPVATTRDAAGNISHSAITFGMIRRARQAIGRYHPPTGYSSESALNGLLDKAGEVTGRIA